MLHADQLAGQAGPCHARIYTHRYAFERGHRQIPWEVGAEFGEA